MSGFAAPVAGTSAPYERVAFGHGEATRVRDPKLVRHVESTVARALGGTSSERLVPPLPISPETKHVGMIRAGSYAISEKADGVRYLMCLFTAHLAGDWRRVCALYARDRSLTVVQLNLAEHLFSRGSAFDAELVRGWDGIYRLLVFDCYLFDGTVMRSKPFGERTVCVHRFVNEHHVSSGSDPFSLVHKRFVNIRNDAGRVLVEQIERNANDDRTFEYATDGAVLIKTDAEVHMGTNRTMFKFKFQHTVDLRAQTASGFEGYELCASRPGARRNDPPQLAVHVRVEALPDNAVAGDVLECAVVLGEGGDVRIEPLHVRRDKAGEPNSEWVVQRTIQTVRDNVQLEDVMVSGG